MTSDKAAEPNEAATGPLAFDTSVAHQARCYDYMLGGNDNYPADRAAVEAWLEIDPEVLFTARANRAFLGRAVGYLATEAGIRQFLDIGTGIPTAGNTHQVAQAVAPDSRVVYVEYDPIVLAHARALLTTSDAGATEYIDADLRDTDAILDQAGALLDFTRPVAVTLLTTLHAIPDSDAPHAIVARLLDAVAAGSYLVVSHWGADFLSQEKRDGLRDITNRMVQQPLTPRSREQVAQFFAGTDLVEPGLVRVEEWHQEPVADSTARSSLWGAVGRKR